MTHSFVVFVVYVRAFPTQRFERRQEFIFRTKEAVRMATAIEFYIEKFMSVMHLTLEGDPSAYDNGGARNHDRIQSPMSHGNAGEHLLEVLQWHAIPQLKPYSIR